MAGLSAALYLAVVVAQYAASPFVQQFGLPEWEVGIPDGLPSIRFAQYVVVINGCGFFAVAVLAGSLAEGLRSAGTRLVDASTAIADLRAFDEHVIDSLVSGLVTADAEGRILTFNRAAAVITGRPGREAVGCQAADVLGLPVGVRERLLDLGEFRSLRSDFTFETADRRRIELGVTVGRLTFPDGQLGYLFTFQDVTDVKRLERDAGLRQRLAAVGEMAAGIAHEIRNPLASMSGSIQVLREELPLSAEQAQLMDIVLRESERLNQTIRSFLDYARPQRSTITRIDVGAAVRDTALLLRNRTGGGEGHVVEIDVPPDPVWLDADENQVRQVVWNLATNGLRAMAGGGRLRLSARHVDTAAGGEVLVTVSDEGCGIPADQIEGIFQPFRSSFERGTGLGLAIVHRIVTESQGTIDVSSTVGEGTTIRVHLPSRERLAEAADAPVPVRMSA